MTAVEKINLVMGMVDSKILTLDEAKVLFGLLPSEKDAFHLNETLE